MTPNLYKPVDEYLKAHLQTAHQKAFLHQSQGEDKREVGARVRGEEDGEIGE